MIFHRRRNIVRNRFYLYPLSLLTLFLLYNYQAVLGPALAQVEIWKLRSNALITTQSNPPDTVDSFDNGISDLWNTSTINDSNTVNPGPKFGAGSFDVTDGHLYLRLNEELNFNGKTYQNVALFGFRGYVLAPGRDVVARAVMQASPNFFGTAGIVFERANTFNDNGSYKPGSSFDMFGASVVGPESDVFGNSGAMCSLALNMWPSTKEISDVNIYEPHEYEFRIRGVGEEKWIGIVSVDGEQKCQMELPPFGPLEAQIWSDGYLLKTSPWWKLGIPQMGFQTGNKWFAFDSVDVVSE
jgi:hypothetical protein